MDVAAVADAAATNAGLLKRRQFFSASKTVDMIGHIHADLASQQRLIPSDVGIKIKLQRSKDAFCLMSPTANSTYKLQIVECKMFVRKVRVSNSVYIGHAEQLQVQMAKFPITRVICKTFTVSQGNLNFVQESLFNGQMPVRLIIGMVDNDAYNGVYDKNPFNFKNYDLAHIKIFLDGTQQLIKPIETTFTGAAPNYIQAYHSLFDGIGKYGIDEGLDITREEYKDGFALFAFDLTPDKANREHLNLQRDGTLRVEGRFKTALPNTINVLVYAEFENIVQIDRHHNVIYDYNK
jgi:hypothetical protein